MKAKRFLLLSGMLLAGCTDSRHDSFQGYVEADFVYVASSQAGLLESVSAQKGKTVQVSDPLFTLEIKNESAAFDQTSAQLKAAEAQIEQTKTEAKHLKVQLVRDEEQFKANTISKAHLDDTRSAYEITLRKVQQLQAQAQANKAATDQAQWKIDQKEVHATRSGLIYDVLYRRGEWVPAGAPVIKMLPPENNKVRFFLAPTELGRVYLGQTVALECQGCPAPLVGQISFIAHEAEYTPTNIYSYDTQSKLIFMVEAQPNTQDASRIHPGQPMVVRLR